MTYQQTLEYLFTRLPMYSRIGMAAYRKDLTNTITLCDFLDNPQHSFKSIHIAGTNGKGSVSHMLAAILQTAGYKTGLYTSPHLKDFRERIKINGEMISEEAVVDFTERIKPLSEKIEPSFFEITVAMAFDHFAKEKVDIAIIEVGLGGRFDSTNIINPEISVITNIGWDHMNILGDSLEKIAFEKAGIIKPNVPVVIGEKIPETETVFKQVAKEKNAPLSVASEKKQVASWNIGKNELIVSVQAEHYNDQKTYHLDLQGIYQNKNIITVLDACRILIDKGWHIDDEMIHRALKQVKKLTGLHGRWDILRHSPLLVLDVAHNADGIKQLVQQIELTEHNKLHIIFGLVKDKDAESILRLLPKQAEYYFTKAQIPRALPEADLQLEAGKLGLNGKAFSSVHTAIYAASLQARKNDMIIVCGSIFLVGEVNPAVVKEVWGKENYSGNAFDFLDMVALSI